MRAYLPDKRLPREELGFSRFSRLKTENRPSLSGRFSCPVWAAPAGRRARLFSHAEASVTVLIADSLAAVLPYLTTALSAFYSWSAAPTAGARVVSLRQQARPRGPRIRA